ncbi:hypothetical protein EKO27_g7354 [Xylaria grammica]|uniref:Cytochrome b5 heme-binding domain-containing protein n=1 Tax=Xylaria grammica TaxID=363999 RepID=A0A439D0H1_9PEZI|nr:hypothetical protein EKO27_g7354 [Xylaria grammica]
MGKFEPKVPVNLDPPKDDPITLEELAKANVTTLALLSQLLSQSFSQSFSQSSSNQKPLSSWINVERRSERLIHTNALTPIQGKVYDVSANKAYREGGTYNVFAGKDASRALAKSSKEPEDVQSEWRDLDEERQGTLNDWITFFSKRYNIVGVVQGATNME